MVNLERPLDLLNFCRNNNVIVYLKDGKKILGKLISFDLNINLTLENAQIVEEKEKSSHWEIKNLLFIKGDNVVMVSPNDNRIR